MRYLVCWFFVTDSTVGLLLDSINKVLHAVAVMPTSSEARTLTERALDCERKVKGWSDNPPTAAEREAMMQHILGLHTAIGKLQQSD